MPTLVPLVRQVRLVPQVQSDLLVRQVRPVPQDQLVLRQQCRVLPVRQATPDP